MRRELDALPPDFPLPRLLLQPLVENAVRHGIQPLREGGEIALSGRRESDACWSIVIANPLPASPAPGGHGLGLDNVRQRVAYRYGPRAQVQAGPQGDRFVVRLRLPLEAVPRHDPACDDQEHRWRRAMRVLIVDDEPLARMRLAALLGECEGAEVVGSVGDGEAALVAIAEQHRTCCCWTSTCLDSTAPRWRGGWARARGRRWCSAPPTKTTRIEAFDLGAVDYLLKPVRLERLREALQRAGRRLEAAPRDSAGLPARAPARRTGTDCAGRGDLPAGRGKIRGGAARRRRTADRGITATAGGGLPGAAGSPASQLPGTAWRA